jgi:hypothetical protein
MNCMAVCAKVRTELRTLSKSTRPLAAIGVIASPTVHGRVHRRIRRGAKDTSGGHCSVVSFYCVSSSSSFSLRSLTETVFFSH